VDLDDLAIGARQRSGWSALDLGFTLTRLWWRPLFLSWFIPAFAVWSVLHLLLYAHPGVAIFLTWWLKPLYDRFPLYLLSKRLFGEEVSLRDTLRHWREICAPDIVPWLLWRRLNPMRSFVMPVTLLEGLRGGERGRRLAVLQLQASGYALWLTIICVHIETLLPLDTILTWFLLLPGGADFDPVQVLLDPGGGQILALNLMTLLAMALVGPFYVAAGFALYINRRIELEGWDIEVAFRGIAERARSRRGTTTAAALLALACIMPGPALTPAHAQAYASRDVDAATARAEIDAVLAGDAFHNVQTITRWRWKNSAHESVEGEIPEWFIEFIEWIEPYWPEWELDGAVDPSELFATVLRGAVVGLVLLLLIFLLLRYRQALARWTRRGDTETDTRPPPPETLFGMRVTRDSLPRDIPAEVSTLWLSDRRREAIALLYRATLSKLIHHCHFDFGRGMTETECAELVAAGGDGELTRFVQGLTGGWMRLAYGHVEPEGAWVAQQCRRWQELFADEE